MQEDREADRQKENHIDDDQRRRKKDQAEELKT
jgi:hypothetical protein